MCQKWVKLAHRADKWPQNGVGHHCDTYLFQSWPGTGLRPITAMKHAECMIWEWCSLTNNIASFWMQVLCWPAPNTMTLAFGVDNENTQVVCYKIAVLTPIYYFAPWAWPSSRHVFCRSRSCLQLRHKNILCSELMVGIGSASMQCHCEKDPRSAWNTSRGCLLGQMMAPTPQVQHHVVNEHSSVEHNEQREQKIGLLGVKFNWALLHWIQIVSWNSTPFCWQCLSLLATITLQGVTLMTCPAKSHVN